MKKEDLYNKIINNVAKEVKNVLNEGMPLENVEQYEKIRDIDYVFDDLEQIPNSERKRQYMFPLSGVAASVPFGHKISFADEKNPYIIESASKTYDAKYTLKEMKSLFGLEDWQVKEYVNPGISVTLMMLFGNIYDNKDVLIKAMESYGWSFAFESFEKIIGNEHWVMLHFDPIYQDSVNDEISLNPILFHWTPQYNIKNIKLQGLVPLSNNYLFSYPPKVHLMKGTIDETAKISFGKELCHANKDTRNTGNYVLIDVDTKKIPYHVDYFYDPRFENGYYTKDCICRDALIKYTNVFLK